MSPTRPDRVVAKAGLKEEFFKRHRKNRRVALKAWKGLLDRRSRLEASTGWGEPIPRKKWPRTFKNLPTLWLIPELPHRFRALYTVIHHPLEGVVVRIEWIGDHKEYDRLFGYRTS